MERFVRETIDRVDRIMTNEQLEHAAPRPLELRRVGFNFHPIEERSGTGRDGPWQPLHVNEARPARTGRRDAAVVAQRRHVNTGAAESVQHRTTISLFELLFVDDDAEHPGASLGLANDF
jgi:hypothetical protein